jgi:RHS repeat-associated protein
VSAWKRYLTPFSGHRFPRPNGNLTADGFHAYAWEADGNVVTVGSVGLTYDALDRMVEQNAGGSYTQLVYGPNGNKLALMNGQTLFRGRVPLPGGVLAIYWSNPLTLVRYWHPNWQGSAPAITSSNQTMLGDEAYAPYGEQYAENGGAADFTGQWAATEPDLYDFPYREYHPTQGRWLTPDPAGLAAVNPSNPQSWNRYAYVMNNPVTFNDPLGLQGQTTECPPYVNCSTPSSVLNSTWGVQGTSSYGGINIAGAINTVGGWASTAWNYTKAGASVAIGVAGVVLGAPEAGALLLDGEVTWTTALATGATISSGANALNGIVQIAGAPPTVTSPLGAIADPIATAVTAATGSEQAGTDAQIGADAAQVGLDLQTGNASALYADVAQLASDVAAQAGGAGAGGDENKNIGTDPDSQ